MVEIEAKKLHLLTRKKFKGQMYESLLRVQPRTKPLYIGYFGGVPLRRLGDYNLGVKNILMEQQQNTKAFDIRRATLITAYDKHGYIVLNRID